ncbi:MAG: DUF4834 domain-containing protein [Bacteroidetes bacterium]|nr:DUF4834 domain-containing protein [Bacteroidota bacterium]MBS1539126.1 DUF4834 domain-containing protein [Bacteroidota bacterium]
MLRLLVIIALIVYILSKVSNLLFRGTSSAQQNRNFQNGSEGKTRVDSQPKKSRQGTIKGGDYVDYEEVK